MPKIKKVTGERMGESKAFIPHYYVSASIDMTAALEFRKNTNAQLEASGIKISVNDLIIKAAAMALVLGAAHAAAGGGDAVDADWIG